jgi:hypothetical protein
LKTFLYCGKTERDKVFLSSAFKISDPRSSLIF